MTKKKVLEHEHLEIKNNLLGAARAMWNSPEFEKKLASLIIYASFSEYLSEHLLNSIRYAVEIASYTQFNAIVFLNSDDKQGTKPLTMYDYLNRLDGYEFPDKANILSLFKNVCKARNKLFHDFARMRPDDSDKLDQYIQSIPEGVEDLINRVNVIEATIKTLTNYNPVSQEEQQSSVTQVDQKGKWHEKKPD